MEQPPGIDYQAVIDNYQAENERLRERVMRLLLSERSVFGQIADWWACLDAIERYTVVAGTCVILVAIVSIVNLLRRK